MTISGPAVANSLASSAFTAASVTTKSTSLTAANEQNEFRPILPEITLLRSTPAALQHIKIAAHGLGGDSEMLADLRHSGASTTALDQQLGDRPLPLGRIHRHGWLSGTIFTRMTQCMDQLSELR